MLAPLSLKTPREEKLSLKVVRNSQDAHAAATTDARNLSGAVSRRRSEAPKDGLCVLLCAYGHRPLTPSILFDAASWAP